MTLSVFVFICRFRPIPCLNALFEYLIEDITHEKENMSKKRKLDDDHDDPAPKSQAVIGLENTATDVTDAMDVAGFVPTEITKLIQRGYSHAEALVQIINNWPNSKRTTRRLQQWMKQTFGMDSCLEPSHSYSRFYQLFVEPPERDVRGTTFYFASMPQMNEALLHWLQSYPADQIVHLHWNEWQKDRKNVPAWELPLAVFVQILERMISQRQTKLIPPESRFTTICPVNPFGRHVGKKYLWISIHEHRFHAYKSSHAESLVRWAEMSPNVLDKQRKIEKWLSKRSIRRLDEKERSNLSTVLQMDMACVGDSNHSNAFYSISCNGEYSYFNSVPAACHFLKAFLTTFPEQTVHVTSDELCKGKARMSLLLSKFMRRLEIVVEKKKPMILINDMYVSVYPQGRCQYVGDTRVWVSKYSFHSTTTLEFKKIEWYNYD